MNGIPDGSIDPTHANNYEVMNELLKGTTDFFAILVIVLFSEISELFIDDYIHLGGDEVELECWLRTDFLGKNCYDGA